MTGPYQTSNWTGPTTTGGYGLYNEYDPSQNPAGSPNIVQGVKRSDLTAYASSPQTRYSFFSNGNFDITDSIQFYTEARFEQSLTHTYLTAPPSVIGGWGAAIPFDETTDSPINPAMISSASTPTQLAAIYNAFEANPTTNAYTNPGYLGPAAAGAHHPVPWQMALLLDTRSFLGLGIPIGPAQANGGPVNCNNTIAASECPQAGDTASWELWWTPKTGLPPRNTIDTTQVWQIDTGFRFPLGVSDWTGDVYYSRGQSSDITTPTATRVCSAWRPYWPHPITVRARPSRATRTTAPRASATAYRRPAPVASTTRSSAVTWLRRRLPERRVRDYDVADLHRAGQRAGQLLRHAVQGSCW